MQNLILDQIGLLDHPAISIYIMQYIEKFLPMGPALIKSALLGLRLARLNEIYSTYDGYFFGHFFGISNTARPQVLSRSPFCPSLVTTLSPSYWYVPSKLENPQSDNI